MCVINLGSILVFIEISTQGWLFGSRLKNKNGIGPFHASYAYLWI